MKIKKKVKNIMVGWQDRLYEKQLSAGKVNYHTWVMSRENRLQTGQVQAVNQLQISGQEEVVLWHHQNCRINPNAYGWITAYFRNNPQVLIAYGDEDLMAESGERKMPWYKPEWSPDTYLSCLYPGSLIAVRSSFVKQLKEHDILSDLQAKKRTYDSAQELRSWLDRAVEAAGGYERGSSVGNGSIGRIPHILTHVSSEGIRQEYLECASQAAACEVGADLVLKDSGKKLSVIIPSKDNPDMLKQCLDSLRKSAKLLPEGWARPEIIVVDNGSTSENRDKIQELLKNDRYLYIPQEFHFSKMCNQGAEVAVGEVLLFLNDDVEFAGGSWLPAMLGKAIKSYVGAVGLKLYYPGSVRIQHAGITNLPAAPVHKLQGLEDTGDYYFGKNRYDRNCLAVTGACLMIETDKFQEAGGFAEELAVAYNDVDICMTLAEAGYRNVVINRHFAYHHESVSRGLEISAKKQKRLAGELECLKRRHPVFREYDPYYPAELNVDEINANVAPGYHGAFNVPQSAAWCPWKKKSWGIREDACLLVSVERCDGERLQGYSVVLGANNACFDRYLVLQLQDSEQYFRMPCEGQYRWELEENLPDQKAVALGGFDISHPCKGLPAGSYRVGVLAVDRLSSLKLLNFSPTVLFGETAEYSERFQEG